MQRAAAALSVCIGVVMATAAIGAHADVPAPTSPAARKEALHLDKLPPLVRHGKATIDHSGRKEKGIASWYGGRFAYKLMADGKRMNPHANIAASKTLPLGTTAKVVNLRNGKAVTVKVEDRGPFVDGRVVDVTPKVATELGMKKQGLAPVVVKPITVPQPDGDVKLGAGAAGMSPTKIKQAAAVTKELVGDKGTQTAEK